MDFKQAAQDFRDNVFPHLFKGERIATNKDYNRCHRFCIDIGRGVITEGRTATILMRYAPERYRIVFEMKKSGD